MADIHWPRVREILDEALHRWEEKQGRKARMTAAHQGHIGWSTKEELAASTAYDKQLIEPGKVGNGLAEETNLVRILTSYIGAYRRMPSGGPYLSRSEIQEITDWIDAGMPD